MRLIFLAALFGLAIAAPGGFRAAGADVAGGYKSMPWHLVDIWWDLGKESEFESYSVDVDISADVPGDVNLYIAPIGLGKLSGTDFYGGIQTNCDGRTKADPAGRSIGQGVIFSMWGERSLDAIRPSVGGFCQSSGSEGDFISVRRAYAWKKGLYTYRLVRMDREMIDGKPYTWVGAFVYSHERDENIFVGALRFKGEKLVLDRHAASFIEIYGRRRPVADIPKLTVTFGNLRVNGEAVKLAGAKALYPKGVPDYADTAAKDDSLVVTVGQEVADRNKREVQVIGGK
ncbi:MAG TPA: hypothetical protein VFE47_00095 [Tepidisphaeraceae bacterium]|jgi:hypothetical protein|nr:hypothetical protein [Tepidisphaeraceae bacterium]